MHTTEHKIIALLALALIVLSGYVLFVRPKEEVPIINLPTIPTHTTTPETPVVTTPAEPVAQTPTPVKAPAKPVTPPIPVGTDRFIVTLSATSDTIADNLITNTYITDKDAFVKSIGDKPIAPGAYKISHEMTAAQILTTLRSKPYMKWVVIPPGLRKEEMAELFVTHLGWTAKQKSDFITKDTTTTPDKIEGVYAPDTYLIPLAETTTQVAARLNNRFNENFAQFLPQFAAKNIKWTTGLTLASLVQREATNPSDMPLIAGILWNRLNQNMQLGVDATLQYIRGNKGAGWWAPISVADKKIDSPYNTYIHTGLPPHPIANPNVAAIAAVLSPATTDCLYYLHDRNHVTHCSKTYEEHQANIETYLK